MRALGFALALALALGLCFCLCLAGCGSPGPAFIASENDFAPFQSWRTVDLGSAPLAGHPPGPRVAFLNERPVGGEYPVGSIIVKAIEPSNRPQDWDLFAMVKRGGGFNAEGARDWEFFLLRIYVEQPRIVSRGIILSDPSNSVYGGSGVVLCNGCHAGPGTGRTDHILSPPLQP